MSKKQLNAEEIAELRACPFVSSIISGRITFTPEFKRMAYSQLIDGKSMREIFEKNGIDPEILGDSRIWGFAEKLRKNADLEGGFEDQRGHNSRKPATGTKEQALSARVEQLEHELAYTRQEVEFLKKFIWPIRRRGNNGNPSTSRSKVRTHPGGNATGQQPPED